MKNSIAKLTSIFFLLGTVLSASASQLTVRAFIDGRSNLIIQGNNVWWHHYDFVAPGRWTPTDPGNQPTFLNNTPWFPNWPQPGWNWFCNCDSSVYSQLSPTLGSDGSPISVSIVSARGGVTIVQQPSQNNNFTAIVEFNDNGPSGAAWYEVNIFYNNGPPDSTTSIPIDDFTLISDATFIDADTQIGASGGGVTITGAADQGIVGVLHMGRPLGTSAADPGNGDGWRSWSRVVLDFDVPLASFGASFLHVLVNPHDHPEFPRFDSPATLEVFDGPSGGGTLIGRINSSGLATVGKRIDFVGIWNTEANIRSAVLTVGRDFFAVDGYGVSLTPFIDCANDIRPPQVGCVTVKASTFYNNPPRIVGWFRLFATDNCDPDALIYLQGSLGNFVAGPFHSGDQVEIARGLVLTPQQLPSTFGGNVATVQLNGDVLLWAVDASGNASTPIKCK